MSIPLLRSDGLPRRLQRRLIAALQPAPGERILEIRPYGGRIARHVAEQLGPTGRLDLVDIPEHMLDDAVQRVRKRASTQAAPVVPTVADPRCLPFGDHTFTAAYLVGVLPTLPDTARVLDELHRVLHPAGRLIIADHRRPRWLPPQYVRHRVRRHGFAVVAQRGRTRYAQVLRPLREVQRVPGERASAHAAAEVMRAGTAPVLVAGRALAGAQS